MLKTEVVRYDEPQLAAMEVYCNHLAPYAHLRAAFAALVDGKDPICDFGYYSCYLSVPKDRFASVSRLEGDGLFQSCGCFAQATLPVYHVSCGSATSEGAVLSHSAACCHVDYCCACFPYRIPYGRASPLHRRSRLH